MTYPNVLVMGYLKETGQLTPEWQMKLESAINAGYQRLLTFEVPGGGFDWYGRAPANVYLTAYGILQLTDMNKVYPIDTAILDRAKKWLYRQQHTDGSWGDLAVTAYTVWSLREAGVMDSNLARAIEWLRARSGSVTDPYLLALLGLALGDDDVLRRLESFARVEEEAAKWLAEGQGLGFARGGMADLEATALSALALMRHRPSPLVDQALTTIARAKDPNGSWHSTQATIFSIKALLETTRLKSFKGEEVVLRLRVNGVEIENALADLTPENFDVVQQVELPVVEGENRIEIDADEPTRLSFQIAGRYFIPWELVPAAPASPLVVSTRYDHSELSLSDKLAATTLLEYTGPGTFMVIVDLGIPPGFTPDAEAFDRWVADKAIDKYTMTHRQITLYFGALQKGQRIEFRYSLTPRFPIDAQVAGPRAYEYYTPQRRADRAPDRIRVVERF